jgi:hypothetical protein
LKVFPAPANLVCKELQRRGCYAINGDTELAYQDDPEAGNEWGGKQTEQELIARLHQTKEDIPKNGILIDATAPIERVVDEIVRQSEQISSHKAGAW